MAAYFKVYLLRSHVTIIVLPFPIQRLLIIRICHWLFTIAFRGVHLLFLIILLSVIRGVATLVPAGGGCSPRNFLHPLNTAQLHNFQGGCSLADSPCQSGLGSARKLPWAVGRSIRWTVLVPRFEGDVLAVAADSFVAGVAVALLVLECVSSVLLAAVEAARCRLAPAGFP